MTRFFKLSVHLGQKDVNYVKWMADRWIQEPPVDVSTITKAVSDKIRILKSRYKSLGFHKLLNFKMLDL